MTYRISRRPMGRLASSCDRCGDSRTGTVRAVHQWQREHVTECPLLPAPATPPTH